ncbi:MAG: carboxylating nicotinate-nucleotide diphosphorylase [Gammaproteobacteria bacterium]|nr:carboxylating nicotinate-nucleotide diphosphorylase [Gammaproteobacteria bacterium]
MPMSDALQDAVTANVRAALAEDVGSGDVSASLIDPAVRAQARVITREAGIFCGKHWVRETARQVSGDVRIDFGVSDGDTITPGQALFSLEGPAHTLLTAERTMLNFVQLLSGTATATRRFVDLIADTRARILDTRKTIPGLRAAQKYAVRCGGGSNHRMGLYDAFLIKENHIAAAGSIKAAIESARAKHPDLPLEVEVENLEQLREVINGRADIAMLDNFSLADTVEAVAMAKRHVKLEASGGIDDSTIRAIAETGVDYISVGEITKRVQPLDLSMRFI